MPSGGRPASAMAGLGLRWPRDSGEESPGEPRCSQQKPESQSWFSKTIGRTPSLPSTLGKKKHAFFKRFQCRKVSAPTFAQAPDPPQPQVPSKHHHHHHHHQQQQQHHHEQQQLLLQQSQEAAGSPHLFNLIISHEAEIQPEPTVEEPPNLAEARQTKTTSSSRSFNWLKRSPCHPKKVSSQDSGGERQIRYAGAQSLQAPDDVDRQQRRRRFLSCSGLGAAEDAIAFYDIGNGGGVTTTNSSDNNNEEDQGEAQVQQTPFLLLDCGCCSGQLLSKNGGKRFLLNEYPPDGSQLTSLDDAVLVVDDLRLKFRCRGQQIIGYRRKLRQQRSELSHLRAAHRKQLEEISSQLLLFESSLRTKEKQLQETLLVKDQVILKQQRVIKRLLKKRHKDSSAPSCSVEDDLLTPQTSLELMTPSLKTLRQSSSPPNIRSKSEPDYEAQNDSDSAIMLEDSFTEVSLAVPNLRNITNGIIIQQDSNSDDSAYLTTEVKVTRSVSDVVNKQRQEIDCRRQPQINAPAESSDLPSQQLQQLQQLQQQQQHQKQLAGRKTKEERRISNRQKLLLLKRHSGFLKRPEILETVYSVEEDSEQAAIQQQHYHKQQQQQQQHQTQKSQPSPEKQEPEKTSDRKKEELKLSSSGSGEGTLGTSSPRPYLMRTTSVTSNESPCLSRRSSASTSCVLTGFRYRIDSDFTDADYSTDDDSTRLIYSETEGDHSGGGTCSCSQPCSRRSSYGYTNSMEESQVCNCAQCLAHPRISASAPTSRRSSYGSQFIVKDVASSSPSHSASNNNNNNGATTPRTENDTSANSVTSQGDDNDSAVGNGGTSNDGGDEAKVFNRVMSNHRTVVKPKDVKFKRINKAKARSLEELRDKLKWEQVLESVSAEEMSSVSMPQQQQIVDLKSPVGNNRLAIIRGYMERSASFDIDSLQESSVA